MTLLSSFPNDCRVAVIGANGGIGSALVGILADEPRVSRVYALSRTPPQARGPNVTPGAIDLTNEDSISRCAQSTAPEGPLDIVIVATGLLWSGDQLAPEKSMRELQLESLARVFAINAAGPTIVAKHFLPHLRRGSKTVFAALSARVGSIGDNRLGGWYAYRASKAALNMLLKTLAIEHARRWPQSIVLGLHPGTVDTTLSRPYTGRTAPDKLFAPKTSAEYLVRVVDNARPDDTGHVIAWNGERIES